MLNRAKVVLVVDRLRVPTFEEGQPFRRHISVRSTSHDRTGIDCPGALICGDDDSLNRITDAILEPYFGGPGDTRIRLSIHDPHGRLTVRGAEASCLEETFFPRASAPYVDKLPARSLFNSQRRRLSFHQ